MLISIISKVKLKHIFIILLVTAALIFVKLYLALSDLDEIRVIAVKDLDPVDSIPKVTKYPVLVWWTPFTGDDGSLRNCDNQEIQASCHFTNNRNYIKHHRLMALLFYGSSFSPWDLPPKVERKPQWALLHEESPRNNALLQHKEALSLFNFSATFSRHSHFPLTLQHLTSLNDLTGDEFFVPWDMKSQLQKELDLAPVVYIQSDCDTATDRDTYVQELMKHVRVDSYGACLQNKHLPPDIQDSMSALHNKDFWKFQARYKFSIAFENGECNDYITEKLWRPLVIGSVPIYFGAATVKDWTPDNKSAIHARDFPSPKKLAEYILQLDGDKEKYSQHLKHKFSPISDLNKRLVAAMNDRTWSVGEKLWNNFEEKTMVEEYECFICRKLRSGGVSRVDEKHYECPVPSSPLTKEETNGSFWFEQWHQGKFEAQLLRNLIHSGEKVTQDGFYQLVGESMAQARKRKK